MLCFQDVQVDNKPNEAEKKDRRVPLDHPKTSDTDLMEVASASVPFSAEYIMVGCVCIPKLGTSSIHERKDEQSIYTLTVQYIDVIEVANELIFYDS